MNLKQALARIEELERRVKELEAKPPVVQHFHYQFPAQPVQPSYPTNPPWYSPWVITSTSAGTIAYDARTGETICERRN